MKVFHFFNDYINYCIFVIILEPIPSTGIINCKFKYLFTIYVSVYIHYKDLSYIYI